MFEKSWIIKESICSRGYFLGNLEFLLCSSLLAHQELSELKWRQDLNVCNLEEQSRSVSFITLEKFLEHVLNSLEGYWESEIFFFPGKDWGCGSAG